MKLSVLHQTQYQYPAPAQNSFNELWMRPVDDERQRVLDFSLEVLPAVPVHSRTDYYGNLVHFLRVDPQHQALSLCAKATVITTQRSGPEPVSAAALQPLRNELYEFLMPTGRVPLDEDWHAVLDVPRPQPGDDLEAYVVDATLRLNARFRYTPEVTAVDTPLTDFVRLGAGVCQDYSHAMLAILRSAGIPARYTSGYIPTGYGPGASHAWVEVFFPGSGWYGFDATSAAPVSEGYVKVAHGRDYDDCPPLKGLRWGGGQETLQVQVQVTATE